MEPRKVFEVDEGGGHAGRVTAYASGCLGGFECVDDPRVARRLLGEAVDWLRRGGVGRVLAPVEGDLWHGYRLSAGGSDDPPFPGEPRNLPYYPALFRAAGFRVAKRWSSLVAREVASFRIFVEAGAAAHAEALAAGFRFEPMDPGHAAHGEAVHALLSRAFSSLLGFTPIPLEEFDRLCLAPLRGMDVRFSRLARDREGRVVGACVAFREPFAPGRFVIHSIAAEPGAGPRRLGAAMSFEIGHQILAEGFAPVIFALMADDSPIRYLFRDGSISLLREYELFEAPA